MGIIGEMGQIIIEFWNSTGFGKLFLSERDYDCSGTSLPVSGYQTRVRAAAAGTDCIWNAFIQSSDDRNFS